MALLSVLGGVQAFGPIGFFVGTMVVAFLHTILKIVRVALVKIDETQPRTVSV
jgi:predicted PurR-regulated permease PerM